MIQSWKLGLATLVMSSAITTFSNAYAWTNCAYAQVIPDNTLGNENSTVTSTGSVDSINGGATRGANLFHSFQEFNVGEGRSAYFTNPAGIENILTRVTGGNSSNILGTLGVEGNANLFLINPNGIIFGSNARLALNGSFVATTANGIGLTNGNIFSTDPAQPLPTELLNVNPNAFFFNQIKAREIVNRSTSSSGLQVPAGKSLLLVGGDVSLQGGRLQAPGGRVELAGVAGAATVEMNVSGNNLSLNFPANVERASVYFTSGAEVNVASGGGGSIAVNARNIEVLGGSSLRAGIGLLEGVNGAQAGDVTLNATETVRVENSSIYNAALGDGNGGKLRVDTGNLIIRDGVLGTPTISQGSSGELIVNAKDSVELTSSPTSNGTISINIPVEGLGSDTSVRVNLPIGLFSLSINAQNLLNPQNISNAPPNLENLLPVASGKAGNLNVQTGRLIVSDGAVVLAGTTSAGSAGDLTVKADDFIELSGISADDSSIGIGTLTFENRIPSGLRSGTTGFGQGGNLTIETGRLIARDGAWVGTNTAGEKPAGELTVNATESIELSGTSKAIGFPTLLANGTRGGGNAQSLTINTKQLRVSDGAIVSSGTAGSGQGGELIINASESVELIGTSKQPVSARVLQELFGASGNSLSGIVGEEPFLSGVITGSLGGSGNAGALTIKTGRLVIRDGAQASVSTIGAGDAGSLTVRASSIELIGSQQSSDPNDILGQSLLTTAVGSGSTGKGGNIDITTKTLSVERGAAISVSSNGLEDAGSLTVKADSIKLNEGNLRATTASGRGGDMNIQVQDLILMPNGSNIATSAAGNGSGGNININAPLVIAVPDQNSDIIADAERGSGGRISINASGILGLEYRDRLTSESDINASSDFGIDGTVVINTLDIDPSSGLVELPVQPVDTQIAQTCNPGGSQLQSEFIVTGRGGLAPNPSDALSTDAVIVDLVTLSKQQQNATLVGQRRRQAQKTTPLPPMPTSPVVEAQGLAIDAVGNVVLTANPTTIKPYSSWQRTDQC